MSAEHREKPIHRCYDCGKEAGGPQDISFTHGGLIFTVFKSGIECPDCTQKKCLENFERYGKEIVKAGEDGPEVNWPLYSQKPEDAQRKMTEILENLGILTSNSGGNWEIVADGPIGLNPGGGALSYLYFTRQADAVEYARCNYEGTLYSWEIRQMGKVISKADALKH